MKIVNFLSKSAASRPFSQKSTLLRRRKQCLLIGIPDLFIKHQGLTALRDRAPHGERRSVQISRRDLRMKPAGAKPRPCKVIPRKKFSPCRLTLACDRFPKAQTARTPCQLPDAGQPLGQLLRMLRDQKDRKALANRQTFHGLPHIHHPRGQDMRRKTDRSRALAVLHRLNVPLERSKGFVADVMLHLAGILRRRLLADTEHDQHAR